MRVLTIVFGILILALLLPAASGGSRAATPPVMPGVKIEAASPDLHTGAHQGPAYAPFDPLLLLGEQAVWWDTNGEYPFFSRYILSGRSNFLEGSAVSPALAPPREPANSDFGDSDSLEPELSRELDEGGVKVSNSNTRVLLACLPSLDRLRGRVSTRWFAPSACPSWHR